MSNLQKSLLKAHAQSQPHMPAFHPASFTQAPFAEEEDEVEGENERKDDFDTLAMAPPRLNPQDRRNKRGNKNTTDFSPLTGEGYFEQAFEIDVPVRSPSNPSLTPNDEDSSNRAATFRVYYTPPRLSSSESTTGSGVVFVFHHGAGYSGLSWASCAREVFKRSGDGEDDEEGEGLAGALLTAGVTGEGPDVMPRAKGKAKATMSNKPGKRAGVLAFDARGHGRTKFPDTDDETDMSLDNLTSDLVSLLKTVFPDRKECPRLVLVGHSMGGAVVANACNQVQKEVGPVAGVAVLDVVEGSALDALQSMEGLLQSQPKSFQTIEQGIEWHIQTGTLNNVQSARTSVPPLLRPLTIPDETHGSSKTIYVWRTDLLKSQPYWRGWFTSLSTRFLNCRTAKLLLLAGTDRLDKDLMIGQMQGKYQLVVMQDVGHCLHEDAPARTAQNLVDFWKRNDVNVADVLKGVKKVGER